MAWQAQVTGTGVTALQTYLQQHLSSPEQKQELEKLSRTDTLTPSQLRTCSQWLRAIRTSRDPTVPTLRAFLTQRGEARVVAQATTAVDPPSAARLQYLAKRREKLLRLDEEMRYGNLVKNVQTTRASKELQRNLTSVKQHFSIGANMIVSRVVAFIVVYMVSRPLTDNETMRIVLGLGGAIGMMVIEMVLFIARATKYDAIEREQKKHREGVF